MSRNDNRASFVKIGLAVVLGVAAIVGTLIYIGGIWDKGEVTLIETYYDRGVSGLSVGSAANFRGVTIGEVAEIGFVGNRYPDTDGRDAGRIYIVIALKNKILGIHDRDGDGDSQDEAAELVNHFVRNGLHATLASNGITGLSRVELDYYKPDETASGVDVKWQPKCLYVPSKMSLMDSFSDSATKVMNQINKMDLMSAWSNVSVSVASLAHAMDGAKVMLETRQSDIEKIMENMAEMSQSLNALSESLRRNPSLLIRERRIDPLPETAR